MIEVPLEGDGFPKQHHPFLHIRSRRLHVVLLLMYAFFCMCQMSAPIGISLACMCNSTAIAEEKSRVEALKALETTTPATLAYLTTTAKPKYTEVVNCSDVGGSDVVDYGGEYVWSAELQSYVVSSMFIGGLIFSYPAGILVDRFSPRHILSVSIAMLTVASAVLPLLAVFFGAYGAVFSRFFMGIGESMLIPALNAMVTKWIPVNEKSLAAAIFTAGNQVSGMFGNVLVAQLCASDLFGWDSIFYSGSLFGVSWLILWHLTVRNSPHNTRWIHKTELDYLANHIPPKHTTMSKRKPAPWIDMMKSKVFWTLMYNSIVGNMMIALIFVYMPLYFKDVLKLDVKNNGWYSAIPHAMNLIAKLIWGYLMDMLRRKKILSPTATVKISQFLSMIGISISCWYLRYMNCTTSTEALILLSLVSAFFGLSISGFYTALLSIAPSHIGTLTSCGTIIGFIGRIATPFLISFFVGKDAGQWSNVLLVYVIVTATGGILFALFASGEVQEWDYSKRHSSSRPNALIAPEPEKIVEEKIDLCN